MAKLMTPAELRARPDLKTKLEALERAGGGECPGECLSGTLEFCPFRREGQCHIFEHNRAVKRAFEAGIRREPLPSDLAPEVYRLPGE